MPHADKVLVEVDNISLNAHLFERYTLLTARSPQLRSIMNPTGLPFAKRDLCSNLAPLSSLQAVVGNQGYVAFVLAWLVDPLLAVTVASATGRAC